jgi:hypothetical protein
VGCVLLTSLVMAVVGRLDDEHAKRGAARPDAERAG